VVMFACIFHVFRSISMGGVRRLLEQDLQLEKKALDAHKTLIGKLVDEVIIRLNFSLRFCFLALLNLL
jgi:hypothetical protein